ncbi:MAG: hypothetical protein AB8B97_22665 [Granulosicoccus sp.]
MTTATTIHHTRQVTQTLMVITQLASILLILCCWNVSEAAIFSCQSGDTTIFQDRPCPQKDPIKTTKAPEQKFPLSIHESWFDIPERAEERAFCDRRGCECGRLEKIHQGSLAQSVADALYLDGSWHRYETSYQAWVEAPSSSSTSVALHQQMLEASCEIMMSQTLLHTYAATVMRVLQKRTRIAEERGFDIKQPCLEEVAEACAYYDSVQLLSRLRSDAFSLRRVRGENQIPVQQPATAVDAPPE